MNRQRYIGSQCPRCRCPYQEVLVFVFSLELDIDSICSDLLISKCHFMSSQSSTTTAAIWQNLMSFIDKSLIKEFLEDPPFTFNIIVLQCHIRIIKVNQIGHTLSLLTPCFLIDENRFTALLVESLDTVGFNILLASEIQFLFYFDLHW